LYAPIILTISLSATIDGKPRPLGITPDQMTDEIWGWLLADGPWPSDPPLAREQADALKHEYDYFYPFDIRSSTKDLIFPTISRFVFSRTLHSSLRANGRGAFGPTDI
jgi:leucyl-tRNA synthetase